MPYETGSQSMIKGVKGIAAVGVVTISSVLIFAAPAYADTRLGGRVVCGPGQQVRISSTVPNGGGTTHYWVYAGVQHGQGWQSGTSHASYTQRRAIDSWRISTDNSITSYGAACV
jgi:hypothetical protein